MTNAKRDNNMVPAITGLSDADGITILRVYADPNTHGLIIDDNTTGSGPARNDAVRDENSDAGLIAVSSADGKTPVPLYIKSTTNGLSVNSI